MGCSHHPGELPLETIRRADWANRLSIGELIELHGEHGCDYPPTAAQVLNIEKYIGPCPSHLVHVYFGRPLCIISLGKPADRWHKVDETWIKG